MDVCVGWSVRSSSRSWVWGRGSASCYKGEDGSVGSVGGRNGVRWDWMVVAGVKRTTKLKRRG